MGENTKNDLSYEFCPRCEANLTLQKGYSNDLPYWICKGCGEMLINPAIDTETDIAWFCDNCEEMLNIQPGFDEECGEWKCTNCGYVNKIDESELYASDDEYQSHMKDPYKGLADEEVLTLSTYHMIKPVNECENVTLCRNEEDDGWYVQKLLFTYDNSIYEYLIEHPVRNMPKIYKAYESDNALIVIEEYIEGRTLADLILDGKLSQERAVHIAKVLCSILKELHNLQPPIVHRDVKPSNIIIKENGEVYLLDVNAAKWYDPEKTDDTRHLGTQYYAAPEQAGYGLSASSTKADIYAVGVLLNVMITGNYPKEERAPGSIWNVIERCISLDADKRYTADELIKALDEIRE